MINHAPNLSSRPSGTRHPRIFGECYPDNWQASVIPRPRLNAQVRVQNSQRSSNSRERQNSYANTNGCFNYPRPRVPLGACSNGHRGNVGIRSALPTKPQPLISQNNELRACIVPSRTQMFHGSMPARFSTASNLHVLRVRPLQNDHPPRLKSSDSFGAKNTTCFPKDVTRNMSSDYNESKVKLSRTNSFCIQNATTPGSEPLSMQSSHTANRSIGNYLEEQQKRDVNGRNLCTKIEEHSSCDEKRIEREKELEHRKIKTSALSQFKSSSKNDRTLPHVPNRSSEKTCVSKEYKEREINAKKQGTESDALSDEVNGRNSITVISVEKFFELSSAVKSFEPCVTLNEKEKASLRVCGGRPSKAVDCIPWPHVREHSYTLYRKNAKAGEDHNECRIFAHGIETVYNKRKTCAVAYSSRVVLAKEACLAKFVQLYFGESVMAVKLLKSYMSTLSIARANLLYKKPAAAILESLSAVKIRNIERRYTLDGSACGTLQINSLEGDSFSDCNSPLNDRTPRQSQNSSVGSTLTDSIGKRKTRESDSCSPERSLDEGSFLISPIKKNDKTCKRVLNVHRLQSEMGTGKEIIGHFLREKSVSLPKKPKLDFSEDNNSSDDGGREQSKVDRRRKAMTQLSAIQKENRHNYAAKTPARQFSSELQSVTSEIPSKSISSISMGLTSTEESEAANDENDVSNQTRMTSLKERAIGLLNVIYRRYNSSLHSEKALQLKSFFDLVLHTMCLKTVIQLSNSEGVTWTDRRVSVIDEEKLEIEVSFSCQVQPVSKSKQVSGTIASLNGKSAVILLSSSEDETVLEQSQKNLRNSEPKQCSFCVTYRIDVRRYEAAVSIDSSQLQWKLEPDSNGWLARFQMKDGGLFMRTKRSAASPEKALSTLIMFYKKHLLSTNATVACD